MATPRDPHGIAIENLLRLGMLSAGVGAGFRGIEGLKNMLTNKQQSLGFDTPSAIPAASIPAYAATHRTDEEEQSPMGKAAGDDDTIATAADWIAQKIPGVLKWPDDMAFSTGLDTPYGLPMATALTAGGAYGGYKLVDMLARRARAYNQERQLGSAKKRYEQALSSQYTGEKASEAAVDDAVEFGDLYEKSASLGDEIVKAITRYKAGLPVFGSLPGAGVVDTVYTGLSHIPNAAGFGTGAYLTALGGVGLGAGALGYNAARSHDKTKAIETAMKEERRRRQEQNQRPILAEL